MNHKQRGFTLIELLVVIAIIGILSSVVLASLNSARQKSRDARRIADIKQLQTALELYYDAQSTPGYPATLTLLAGTYIPTIPLDPTAQATNGTTGGNYAYTPLAAVSGGTPCIGYHLRGTLENASNPVFTNDADAAAGLLCGTVTGISVADAVGTDPIYDVKP